MQKLRSFTVVTYDFGDDYLFDIVTEDGVYLAYLYRENEAKKLVLNIFTEEISKKEFVKMAEQFAIRYLEEEK